MAYADEGMSTKRMVSLGIVALLHLFLGYAFVTGLALKVVKVVTGPLEVVDIKEQTPPPEEPPPPPPELEEIPPYVPPPEVVVQTQAPPPPITTQTVVQTPEPPRVVITPPAPPAPAAAPTPAIPGRGNTMSTDDYPAASLRAEEEGVVRVKFEINEQGRVDVCSVVQSSGFPRLDDATCKVIQRRWRYKPATEGGKPVRSTQTQPVRWRLEDVR